MKGVTTMQCCWTCYFFHYYFPDSFFCSKIEEKKIMGKTKENNELVHIFFLLLWHSSSSFSSAFRPFHSDRYHGAADGLFLLKNIYFPQPSGKGRERARMEGKTVSKERRT